MNRKRREHVGRGLIACVSGSELAKEDTLTRKYVNCPIQSLGDPSGDVFSFNS